MLDKAGLNQCLMKSHASVKRAKTKTITKLKRHIKVYQQSLTKNPENAKLDKKIKKAKEDVEVIKDFDKVDNVKKILTFSGNINAVMCNIKSSVLDRSIARVLYDNEKLRNDLKEIKEKFNLKDDDEEWKTELLAMGKQKRQKLKKRGVTVGSLKKKKKVTEASGNEEEEPEAKPVKKQKKEKKASKEEAVETESTSKESPQSPKKKKKPKKASGDDEGTEEPKSPKKPKKQDKSDKVLQINEKSKKINQKAKNFLNKNKGKDFKKNFNGDSKPQFSGKGPGKPSGKAPGKPFGKPPGKGMPPLQNGSGNKVQKDHPSWEAKKKQKPTIAKFQGKKIKFAD